MLTIGKQIRKERLERNLNQAELAQVASTTPAAICAYELDKRSPRFEALAAIADALQVPLFDLTPLSPDKQKEFNYYYKALRRCQRKLDEPDHTQEDISTYELIKSEAEKQVKFGFIQAMAENQVLTAMAKTPAKTDEIPEDFRPTDSQDKTTEEPSQLKEQLISLFLELSTESQQKLLERANELRVLENYQRLLNSEKGTK